MDKTLKWILGISALAGIGMVLYGTLLISTFEMPIQVIPVPVISDNAVTLKDLALGEIKEFVDACWKLHGLWMEYGLMPRYVNPVTGFNVKEGCESAGIIFGDRVG